MTRLVSLLALALTAALVASFGAASTHASTPVSRANGFSGPVSSAPRAIDRDIESGTLRRVACPVAGSLSCWIAGH